MDDKSIIELFFARSEQAIRELDDKYGKICHKLSYNITNSRRDAEECVNDAYLGAWGAIPPARPDSLLAYLCKIVRNISLMRYRANKAVKRDGGYMVALEELESCLVSPQTVEGDVEEHELVRLIEEFLDTLSPKNRVIMMRRYWFCDSYGEIAERTGISEKNVSVRLTRIRRQLRQYLKEREVLV